MQVVMIMLTSGGERRSFPVVRSTTTIGRREDCDLRIPVGDVSRKHCRLVLTSENVRVQDLGSSNGTFVNGQQVQDAFLNAGDSISVGPVNFVIQIDGVPSEDQFDAPTGAIADSEVGGTALAVDALHAGGSGTAAVGDSGELADPVAAGAADDFAVFDDEPVDAELVGESDDVTLDEAPAGAEPVTLDRVALDDVPPAEHDVSAKPAEDDWDFLIDDAAKDAAGADQPNGHHPPA
jgi:predicted component of type VI protein secretion system